jgi:oligopeptide/dipeptide ABC transporter ATP-binding protein
MSIILITHDLGIVAQTADEVIVMYAGRAVEQGPVARIFATPLHPYTKGLLASIPRLESFGMREPPRLAAIDGVAATGLAVPAGCAFAPRCAHATDRCRRDRPALAARGDGHSAACHLLTQGDA